MTTLLTANRLSKLYPVRSVFASKRRYVRALDSVDLTLTEGETLGIAGESGCGKSTLARLLLGLMTPTSGSVSFRGRPLIEMNRAERLSYRREVQMVFQDPFSSLNPRMRVSEIVGEPLMIHRLASGNALRDRTIQLLEKVGLRAEQLNRYPHEFSGGQRQRIGIARALAVSPRVIIADEPVSALDLSIQAQILNLLQELQREFSLSFILIAHDLSVVRHMSDRVAIMYFGRVVELGGRDQIFDGSRHPYTEALLAAIPQVKADDRRRLKVLHGDIPSPLDPPGGCAFHPRCPYAQERCQLEIPLLMDQGAQQWAACHFSRQIYGNFRTT